MGSAFAMMQTATTGIRSLIEYSMSSFFNTETGENYIYNSGSSRESNDTVMNASNHIYLDGVTQSVPYPIKHTLGADIVITVPTSVTNEDETTVYTKINTTDFDLAVTVAGTQHQRPSMSVATNGVSAGSTYEITFNATITSGTPVLYAYWNGSTVVIIDQPIVNGLNKVEFTFTTAFTNLTHYFDGTNLFDISVTGWSQKEIHTDQSYLTIYDSDTNTLKQISSTGDVGENNVLNGEFTDGLDDWSPYVDCLLEWDNGKAKVTLQSPNADGYIESLFDHSFTAGKTYRYLVDFTGYINFPYVRVDGQLLPLALLSGDTYYVDFISTGSTNLQHIVRAGRTNVGEVSWIDNIQAVEIKAISTHYQVTNSHQFVFNSTSPLTAADVSAIEADPNLAFRMFYDGEALPSGFSRAVDMIDCNFFGGQEGIASAEKVYDLSDQTFLTYVSVIDYDAAVRTTLLNTAKGASNLKLIRDGSGRATGTALAGTTQWEADGRTGPTGWTVTAPFTATEVCDGVTYIFTSDANRYKDGIADGTYTVPTGEWIMNNTAFDGVTPVTVRGNTKLITQVIIP